MKRIPFIIGHLDEAIDSMWRAMAHEEIPPFAAVKLRKGIEAVAEARGYLNFVHPAARPEPGLTASSPENRNR